MSIGLLVFSSWDQRHALPLTLNAVTMVCPAALQLSRETDRASNKKPCPGCQCYIFFSLQRHSVSWVENGRTTPSLPPLIINSPGLVHLCSPVKIQTYILNRLTSLLMCLFCQNCFGMWKYVNIIWLDRRWLWICEVEVEDGAMMNVCA